MFQLKLDVLMEGLSATDLQTCPTHSRYIYVLLLFWPPHLYSSGLFSDNNLLKQFPLTSKI